MIVMDPLLNGCTRMMRNEFVIYFKPISYFFSIKKLPYLYGLQFDEVHESIWREMEARKMMRQPIETTYAPIEGFVYICANLNWALSRHTSHQ